MGNIRVFKTTNDMNERIDFADVAQKLISQPFALRRSFDQPGNVHKLESRRNEVADFDDLAQPFQPFVWHTYSPKVRLNRAERIILRGRFVRSGYRIEERRFPNIRQTHNAGL